MYRGRSRSPSPVVVSPRKESKGERVFIESIRTRVRYAKERELCVRVQSEGMGRKTKVRGVRSEEAGVPKQVCAKSRRSKLCELE